MLSHKAWSGHAVFRLFLGVFSTYCFGNLIVGLLYHFKIGLTEQTRGVLSLLVSLVFLQATAGLWIAVFLRENNMTWRDGFGFGRANSWFAIGIGLLAGMLVVPIAQGMMMLSEWGMNSLHLHPVAQQVVQEMQKPQMPGYQRSLLALLAIVGAPVVEEGLFRGLMYPTIKQAGYPRLALWVTSIIFAATHVTLVTFVPLAFFSVVLILLYEATDNLLAPIAAHSMFNFANFLLLMFQDQLNRALPPMH
ncbi:MAG: Abortive infection protein [Verrucomicrobiales bacterium]|nr:Abortive infection protein [Verrucomicrobiales bacterium]